MSKEVKAINKMIRTSSQKLNLIIKDIRKKDINAAVNILKFSNKRVSKEVLKTLNSADSNGKKLGFISQEIGREINTIGSKANFAPMQKLVVQMKDELEKIKEQLLNVL